MLGKREELGDIGAPAPIEQWGAQPVMPTQRPPVIFREGAALATKQAGCHLLEGRQVLPADRLQSFHVRWSSYLSQPPLKIGRQFPGFGCLATEEAIRARPAPTRSHGRNELVPVITRRDLHASLGIDGLFHAFGNRVTAITAPLDSLGAIE